MRKALAITLWVVGIVGLAIALGGTPEAVFQSGDEEIILSDMPLKESS